MFKILRRGIVHDDAALPAAISGHIIAPPVLPAWSAKLDGL
jgi:hypothetical protein